MRKVIRNKQQIINKECRITKNKDKITNRIQRPSLSRMKRKKKAKAKVYNKTGEGWQKVTKIMTTAPRWQDLSLGSSWVTVQL